MPYAAFTYEVEKHEIVDAEDVEIVDPVGYDRLVLTACHPLYSAAQRWAVFAKLTRIDTFAISGEGRWAAPVAEGPATEPEPMVPGLSVGGAGVPPEVLVSVVSVSVVSVASERVGSVVDSSGDGGPSSESSAATMTRPTASPITSASSEPDDPAGAGVHRRRG